MQVRLTYRLHPGDTGADADADARTGAVAIPAACPHPGCGGRRLRLRQTVAKAVRGDHRHPVSACRYTCLDCGRTFRVYPAGIDRGQVPMGVKALAAALHLLGLGFRDASRALTVLGVPLGKSQIQAATAAIVGDARAGGKAPLFTRVGLGIAAGTAAGAGSDDARPFPWIEVDGAKRSLRRSVDARGRPVLVIDDVDVFTRREIQRWGRDLLAGIGVEVEIVADAITGSWGADRRRRAGGEQWDDDAETREGESPGEEAGAEADDCPRDDGDPPGDDGPSRDEDALGDAGMPYGEGPPGNIVTPRDEGTHGADAPDAGSHDDAIAAATTVRSAGDKVELIIGSRNTSPAHHRRRPKRWFAVIATPPVPAILPLSQPFWGRGLGGGGRLAPQTSASRRRAA